MPSGVDLVRMPGFEYPSSARIDFNPINQALARYTQAGFQQQQADAEAERLGLEHQRFGLQERQFDTQSDFERQRLALQQQEYGLNQQRVGYEGRRLTLAEQQQQQQDEENARIRIGNLAWRIRQLPTPEQRATELGRLMNSSQQFREYVGRMGGMGQPQSDMSTTRDLLAGNADQMLDRMVGDVLDTTSRYQPRPLIPLQPGTTLVQSGLDNQTITPIATSPPLLRSLTSHENTTEINEGQQARLISQALAEFRPEFTRPGLLPTFFNLGDVNNWIGRHFSNASQAQRDAAAWWQRFYLNTDLQQRHNLFGSAFTNSEMLAWNQATITPSMTPQAIIANLQTRQHLVQDVVNRRAMNLVMAGYDPRQIANVYGVPLDSLTSITPTRSLSQPIITPGTQPPPAPPPQAPPPGTQPPPPGGGGTPIPPLNTFMGSGPGSQTAPVRVTGDSDPAYQALPSGARYIGPDGRVRIKR